MGLCITPHDRKHKAKVSPIWTFVIKCVKDLHDMLGTWITKGICSDGL
jgi:hypothetical protein